MRHFINTTIPGSDAEISEKITGRKEVSEHGHTQKFSENRTP